MKRTVLTGAMACVLLAAALPARAEAPDELSARRSESVGEFERLSGELQLSVERQKRLELEIAGIRKDASSITAASIQAAKTERKLSDDIVDMEDRLTELNGRQDSIRHSLSERREVLAEVLGALQRMGLNPPPAILVTPEDALSSVRSAILLGAVVPELRSETVVLLADLQELGRLRESIAAERERLRAAISEQAESRQRLSLLLEEKQRLQAASEAALKSEQERSEQMAARARSLKELIASIEKDIESNSRKVEAARLAEEERLRREAESAMKPVPEMNRLAAAQPFDSLKGRLPLPVSGRFVTRFGQRDDTGMEAFGDTVRTQSGAIVTAPADATVLYAGPFRSYGQLLILDVGAGYHVVLAGLGKINVSQGQPVLAGEPVGAMGEARVASVGADNAVGATSKLYIEFRKEQKPVDPAPWWQDRNSGRAGNDS